jgi:alginate O-acetyltransferase complex protein AlgI
LDVLQPEVAGLGLNSWVFALLGLLAVFAGRVLPVIGRRVALVILDALFVSFFVHRWLDLAVLGAFVLTTWGIGRWRATDPDRVGKATMAAVMVGLWTFLFLVRDPGLLGAANPFHHAPVRLIGISYLVFRSISWINEADLVPERGLLAYTHYLLFFPTLLSGPIERWRRFSELDTEPPLPLGVALLPGLHRITTGLVMKFVLADNLWPLCLAGLDVDAPTSVLWAGVLLQYPLLFLDFAGYCHVAIGLATLIGFPVVENFNQPFRSRNVQEFWERWHISLSTMVRDYVFTPVVKVVMMKSPRAWQFAGVTAVYFGSTVLIGVWHDTTLGFAVFGVLHGAALVVLQIKRKNKKKLKALWPLKRGNDALAIVGTYVFLSLTMIPWIVPVESWGPLVVRLFGGTP